MARGMSHRSAEPRRGRRPTHEAVVIAAGPADPVRRGHRPLSRLAVFSILAAAMGIAGCPSEQQLGKPDRVLETLPPPIYGARPQPLPPPPPPPRVVAQKSLRDTTIVVDPGHGGKDPGTLGRGRSALPEKAIDLDIATQVAGILQSRGARVIMTRNRDYFVELDDRAAIADRYHADLLVSIHADSSPKRYMSGTGIHIHTQANRESQNIAHCIVSSFRRSGISCRGIFRNNFAVLREHNSPGVLIESGFLSNSSDADRLNSAGYRTKLAGAIADGLTDHFGRATTAGDR
jgi:N-acetylmuramoyl-L-alanine amidase